MAHKEYEIFWTQWAKFDLHDILTYISKNSPQAALQLLDKIDENINNIDFLPEKGRKIPELEAYHLGNYREIILSPWRIFYKVDTRIIYIIGIIDGRRNIEDILLKRLMG